MRGSSLVIAAAVAFASLAGAKPPHVLFLLIDDLGFHDLSFPQSGGLESKINTPTLSNLAKEGINLGTDYYVNPICTPTRTSLVSAMYPRNVGLNHGVILDAMPNGLPLNYTTMWQRFQVAGYDTYMIGKHHLGFFHPDYTPVRRGINEWKGYYTGNVEYYNHTSPCWHCGNFTAVDNSFATVDDPAPKAQFNYSGVYSTNMYAGWTMDVIDQHDASTPLFMYLPFEAVHGAASCEPDCNDPSGDFLQAPQFFIDQQKQIPNADRRTFAGMLGALDSAVANITNLLKAKGMWEDTLLIVSTDNGAPSGHFDSQAMSNWPLRGAKGQLWEGGLRGAGFVGGGWSGINPAMRGKNITAMIHVSDWLPTLAHIVGGKAMGGPGTGLPALVTADEAPYSGWVGNGTYAIDGYNVWDTINNGATSPRSTILHNIDPIGHQSAIRMGDFKLLVGMGPGTWYPNPDNEQDVQRYQLARSTSLTDSSYSAKDAFVPQSGPLQGQQVYLFNIKDDPYERINLAESDPDTVAKLTAGLARFPGVPCRYPNPDPNANPTLPGRTGAWAPWRNDSSLDAGIEGAAEYKYKEFE